jgi:maleylacetoacetate isomerase
MKLYDYFRSSAAYRVRIALNLKGLSAERAFVHLVRDGGEHLKPDYLTRNPQGLLPALELDDGSILTQSMAILEYLEETHPEPALLPRDPVGRARVRAVALAVACDIHPLNNLRVLNYLKGPLGQDQAAVDAWYRHWITVSFAAIEQMVGNGPYCFGNRPTLADVCLIPQVFNARRFNTELSPYPRILAVEASCTRLDAFAAAHPSNQPDAE